MSDNQARAQLLLLKGVISELPEDDQAKIKATAQRIRDIMAEDRKANGMAIMLVAVEYSASDEVGQDYANR